MNYKIITKNRGALKDTTPFILDKKKDLVLDFSDLPSGKFLCAIDNKNARRIVVDVKDGKAVVPFGKLTIGLWYIELFEVDEQCGIINKIVCTPILVSTLAAQTKGFFVYPDMDSVVERLSEVEKELETINAWIAENAPKIHTHDIFI